MECLRNPHGHHLSPSLASTFSPRPLPRRWLLAHQPLAGSQTQDEVTHIKCNTVALEGPGEEVVLGGCRVHGVLAGVGVPFERERLRDSGSAAGRIVAVRDSRLTNQSGTALLLWLPFAALPANAPCRPLLAPPCQPSLQES